MSAPGLAEADAATAQLAQKQLAKQQGGGGGADEQKKNEEVAARRAGLMSQLLTPEARERLSRIALVKDDHARQIEDLILRMAQNGQISEKISEDKLKSMLAQIGEQTKPKTKITIMRKKRKEDDDDVDYDL